YDIRGRIPDELNEDIAYRIGRAFTEFLAPERVIVGHDIRLSSPGMTDALASGLTDGGADVYHIGQCGTEEVYFATSHFELDGGIMVTASHNPKDYNGMKLVREESRPISGDTGLNEIKQRVEVDDFSPVRKKGAIIPLDHHSAYIAKLLSYVDTSALSPLKIVVNAGNGGAGEVIDRLEPFLPFDFIKIHHEPNGDFPNGVPNPLLPGNRQATIDAITKGHADMGVAWDGDFDRCFFFDGNGRFIEGYYMVGLLAEAFLGKSERAGEKIVHDPRLTWNTIDIVKERGGVPVLSKTGHAFIKERMRTENAVYGGEMSAHHYFRDFSFCDSGMVPWLLVAGLMSAEGKTLSELVNERMIRFPASGEINRRIEDAATTIARIEADYAPHAKAVDRTDGLSMEFGDWRFNVRM
ncbi:MAG: phosphomannomutase, partial [Pseudomonadales bacterium]